MAKQYFLNLMFLIVKNQERYIDLQTNDFDHFSSKIEYTVIDSFGFTE